jgi:hypothetical protein
MKLSEMIELLQDLANQVDDQDPEVIVQYQPNYPMKVRVVNLRLSPPSESGKVEAWIATHGSNDYGDRLAWQEGNGDEEDF